MVPKSKYRIKATYAMSPTTITIHNTANTAAARNEVAYMIRNNNMTSFHVGVDDKEVVQAIPFNRNAWAAGDGVNGQGNRRSIHIEICYSMDNGYSGAYSSRYRKAEENTALYVAYVLHQYNWGVNRLRQHYNWSRKDCPHKMRAHGRWNAFKKRVQQHLNAIKKGQGSASSSSSKANPSQKKPQKISGATYKVRKGDTLWAISRSSGVSVNNLKSWNGLRGSTIRVGQKLNLKKPAKKSSGSSAKWQYNKHTGAQWKPLKGVWINGNQRIKKRKGSPELDAPTTGWMKAGQRLDYREMARNDGHIWLLDLKSDQWVPVKTWNSKTGKVGKDWGTWK